MELAPTYPSRALHEDATCCDSNAHWHTEVAATAAPLSSFSSRAWTIVLALCLVAALACTVFGGMGSATRVSTVLDNATPLAASVAGDSSQSLAVTGAESIADDRTPMAAGPTGASDDIASTAAPLALVSAVGLAMVGAAFKATRPQPAQADGDFPTSLTI